MNRVAFWVLLGFVVNVGGTGRLLVPPQRSSLWRDPFHFWSPNVYRNYGDHTLDCGGVWKRDMYEGKCGVCGDPWDAEIPRPNEAGGIYAQGVIGRTYYADKGFIDVEVQVMSSIQGYFEFRICPNNDVTKTVTQDCLDQYLLNIFSRDRTASYGSKYYPDEIKPGKAGLVDLSLEMPEGVVCSQCVLQWKWHGGNNWGICENGYWWKGCGPQTEYYNCADIAILERTPDSRTEMKSRTTKEPNPTTSTPEPATTTTSTTLEPTTTTTTTTPVPTTTTTTTTPASTSTTTTTTPVPTTTTTVPTTTTPTTTPRPTTSTTTTPVPTSTTTPAPTTTTRTTTPVTKTTTSVPTTLRPTTTTKTTTPVPTTTTISTTTPAPTTTTTTTTPVPKTTTTSTTTPVPTTTTTSTTTPVPTTTTTTTTPVPTTTTTTATPEYITAQSTNFKQTTTEITPIVGRNVVKEIVTPVVPGIDVNTLFPLDPNVFNIFNIPGGNRHFFSAWGR